MDHTIENVQYGLHSTLLLLGKDVHTAGVTPHRVQRHTPCMKGVHTTSHYPVIGLAQ